MKHVSEDLGVVVKVSLTIIISICNQSSRELVLLLILTILILLILTILILLILTILILLILTILILLILTIPILLILQQSRNTSISKA